LRPTTLDASPSLSRRVMRILLVSVAPLQKELGASKVLIELGEEMERIGWECHWISVPDLVGGGPKNRNVGPRESADALRAYLKAHSGEYDVVDYGLGYLPFPRSEFVPTTLLVGRSVLLIHHFLEIKLPTYRTLKARVYELVYGRRTRKELEEIATRVNESIPETDLVNVANDDDKTVLVRAGAPADKIVVIPYGLGRQRAELFEETPMARPEIPTVAFVGTFDSRKGATDFPALVKRIMAGVPEARFLLLGTHKGRDEVLARFPRAVRPRVEVVPHYAADTLPELLSNCSIRRVSFVCRRIRVWRFRNVGGWTPCDHLCRAWASDDVARAIPRTDW
jgi:glycosyltransferase involved in cell wall biosynthesis